MQQKLSYSRSDISKLLPTSAIGKSYVPMHTAEGMIFDAKDKNNKRTE